MQIIVIVRFFFTLSSCSILQHHSAANSTTFITILELDCRASGAIVSLV